MYMGRMLKISIHQNKLELGDNDPQENESFPFTLEICV
jgi:hypothetical protein